MGAVAKFRNTSVPRQQNEKARFKVVRGPDFGSVYVLTSVKAVIGRGEDCDIAISDLKASRHHAVISLTQNGWIIKDIGSANGIQVNGKSVPMARINLKDTVVVGETVLEFVTAEVGTMFLVAPPRSADEVQVQQIAIEEQKKRVQALGVIGGSIGPRQPRNGPGGGGAPNQKRMLLWGVVAAAGAFFFLMEDEPVKKASRQGADQDKKTETRNLAEYLPDMGPDSQSVARSAEAMFRTGFREFNQGNYLRARNQFETVLQMHPSHFMARLYLDNCEKRIKEEVERLLLHGKKSKKFGKLREARGTFESVQRLLVRDQTNPHYIEATKEVEEVKKLIVDTEVFQ